MPTVTQNTLTVLAKTANSEHAAGTESFHQSIEHFRQAGVALSNAKDQVDHGEWRAWLKKNCPEISERTAQRYMKLAQSKNDVPTSDFWKEVSGNSNRKKSKKSATKKSAARKTHRDADSPPSETPAFVLREDEKPEFDGLVRFLMEKVFHTKSVKDTVMQALKHCKDHSDA